jgi:outer membrane receptor protein involved in Fe transport
MPADRAGDFLPDGKCVAGRSGERSASSVLYGSSALSGVINFRTSYPADTPLTRINVFHGAYSAPQTDSAKYWSYTPMRSGANFLHSRKV